MSALQIAAAESGHRVIPGWNRVLNRCLPWLGAESADEPCFVAQGRFTAEADGQVVGIAQRSVGLGQPQLLVGVDPAYRGRGIGTRLASLVDPGAGPAEVFLRDPHDPAAAALAARHGLRDQGGEPLVLWSLDVRGVGPAEASGFALSPFRAERPEDIDELREAVRWWATDNGLDEAGILAWQADLPGEAVTTVVRDRARAVIGVAWAAPVPFTDLWRSTHLAVSPAHRGRGLGLALKRAQAAQARAAGITGLVTHISGRNRANAIWAAVGAERRDLTSLKR